jgi:hypothetical protein
MVTVRNIHGVVRHESRKAGKRDRKDRGAAAKDEKTVPSHRFLGALR